MSRLVAMLVIAGWVAGCADPNPLIAESPRGDEMPAAIVNACELARTRCSHCHTLDRILHTPITRADEWRGYVHRMRVMPGSAIRADEESVIVRCFVFRQEKP